MARDHDRRRRREAHPQARRPVRGHVQRRRRPRQACATRSTCIQRHCKDVGRDPTEDQDHAHVVADDHRLARADQPQVRDFVTAAAGRRRPRLQRSARRTRSSARSTAPSTPASTTFIFNMPLSDAAAVRRAGEFLHLAASRLSGHPGRAGATLRGPRLLAVHGMFGATEEREACAMESVHARSRRVVE